MQEILYILKKFVDNLTNRVYIINPEWRTE